MCDIDLNISRVKWVVVPTPEEAAVICPGCALASAISSWTDFAGKLGLTTSMNGLTAARATGLKSRIGSKRMFLYMLDSIAMVELVQSMV